ncbi:plant cysteine oxidase 1-like [Ananas comosus]|uniref:cysteine dioxygenase n=1 Tax=Ananas comosus TaxID=4615 RepID=A0A6P5HMV4_ANACO|nr:plant cysteine oxidase 1-like [Ananas comosus]
MLNKRLTTPFRSSTEMSKIQRLYNASSSIFSAERGGLNPTFNQIRWLQDLLDAMEPADVGIDGSSDYENKSQDGLIFGQAIAQITYIHIHESDHFSIGVFCFPAGAKIPLHDHPRMVVLSKVLYGSARVKSYDWVTTPKSKPNMSGLAKVVAENQLLQAPCKASVLFPRSGGNIHSFTAVTPCAILDVLAPPYSEELGRPSTYFSDIPIASVPGFAILEKIEMPDDLNVAGAPYVGPELSVDIDFC